MAVTGGEEPMLGRTAVLSGLVRTHGQEGGAVGDEGSKIIMLFSLALGTQARSSLLVWDRRTLFPIHAMPTSLDSYCR